MVELNTRLWALNVLCPGTYYSLKKLYYHATKLVYSQYISCRTVGLSQYSHVAGMETMIPRVLSPLQHSTHLMHITCLPNIVQPQSVGQTQCPV